jgi:integrase/recombinase XerD
VNEVKKETMIELANEFIAYKRSNSYNYQTGEYYLMKYVASATAMVPSIFIPSKETVNAFVSNYADTPGNLYNSVAVLREFSRYLVNRGYEDAYIFPQNRVRLPTPVQPYFFTDDEIISFFWECDGVKDIQYLKGRHLVLPALYRLIYCCGLRCKEARTLKCENVFLNEGFLDILQSKGPKSRRIFISDDLAEYLKSYDKEICVMFPNRHTFFPNKKDKPYGACMLDKNFRRFWNHAYPEKKDSDISVRLYDARHHFAYANMNRWLIEGKNVNAMLPYLMNYMGHSDVESTLYYFHLVPDIYGGIVEKSLSSEELIPEVYNVKEE